MYQYNFCGKLAGFIEAELSIPCKLTTQTEMCTYFIQRAWTRMFIAAVFIIALNL